jgi:hypothetical protein
VASYDLGLIFEQFLYQCRKGFLSNEVQYRKGGAYVVEADHFFRCVQA